MPSQFAQIDPWKMIDEQRVGLQGYYATIAKQAAEIERLRAALKATESDLFYQIEAKHGPRAASEYPAIKLARETLEHGND